MKDNELNSKINKAFSDITPNVFESIKNDCKDEKGKVIKMTEVKKKFNWTRIVAIAASFVILFSVLGVYLYGSANKAVTNISLDVNPGIEIKLNKNEKVLDVIPLNEDGKIVIGDMNFKGNDLEITVNALVGSMLKNGYISDVANSILVSVSDEDSARSSALQLKVSSDIEAYLKTLGIDGAVLSQSVKDDRIEELAEKYGISFGKAQLIDKFAKANPKYSIEELVGMTVNELNLLIKNSGVDISDINSSGVASDKAYINAATAEAKAFAFAGISSNDAKNLETELEAERGTMVYEVEFKANGKEYEILVNALTGEIFDSFIEDDDDVLPEGNYIGEEKAKEVALKHVNLKASDVKELTSEMEKKGGAVVYEIEFETAEKEYEILVDALSGKVAKVKIDELKFDVDDDDDDVDDVDDDFNDDDDDDIDVDVDKDDIDDDDIIPEGKYIGNDKAKNIALTHAGLKASQVSSLSCDLDNEKGVVIYEIEFKYNGEEYDYEIDAVSGKILKNHKEIDD